MHPSNTLAKRKLNQEQWSYGKVDEEYASSKGQASVTGIALKEARVMGNSPSKFTNI